MQMQARTFKTALKQASAGTAGAGSGAAGACAPSIPSSTKLVSKSKAKFQSKDDTNDTNKNKTTNKAAKASIQLIPSIKASMRTMTTTTTTTTTPPPTTLAVRVRPSDARADAKDEEAEAEAKPVHARAWVRALLLKAWTSAPFAHLSDTERAPVFLDSAKTRFFRALLSFHPQAITALNAQTAIAFAVTRSALSKELILLMVVRPGNETAFGHGKAKAETVSYVRCLQGTEDEALARLFELKALLNPLPTDTRTASALTAMPTMPTKQMNSARALASPVASSTLPLVSASVPASVPAIGSSSCILERLIASARARTAVAQARFDQAQAQAIAASAFVPAPKTPQKPMPMPMPTQAAMQAAMHAIAPAIAPAPAPAPQVNTPSRALSAMAAPFVVPLSIAPMSIGQKPIAITTQAPLGQASANTAMRVGACLCAPAPAPALVPASVPMAMPMPMPMAMQGADMNDVPTFILDLLREFL